MAQHALTAHIRSQKGKEKARKLRKNNLIPAIFYGPGQNPLMLTVDNTELQNMMKTTAGDNVFIGLQIESEKGSETRMVILKELQTDPIKDNYLHADFYEVSMDKELTIDVPVRLINTPKGVTAGGILQHVKREIAISCLPDKLVEFIDIDVSELDIGESLHIAGIPLPEGIKSAEEEGLTVAVVVPPTVSVEKEEEEPEAVETGVEEETASE